MSEKSESCKIQDYDLKKNKYSITILEENINYLSIKTLLYTQVLTAEFCAKYILNDEYASCVEETYICFYDVLQAQKPHQKRHHRAHQAPSQRLIQTA